MRKSLLTAAALTAFGLAACNQDRRDEPAARQLGREAHHAADDVKRGADKAAREARDAGKNFREGWNEAKHDSPPPPPRRDDNPPPRRKQ